VLMCAFSASFSHCRDNQLDHFTICTFPGRIGIKLYDRQIRVSDRSINKLQLLLPAAKIFTRKIGVPSYWPNRTMTGETSPRMPVSVFGPLPSFAHFQIFDFHRLLCLGPTEPGWLRTPIWEETITMSTSGRENRWIPVRFFSGYYQ